MIPALLGNLGLPLLIKWISGAIDKIDHPAAKVAAGALGEVGAAMSKGEITLDQIKEANRNVEALAKNDSDEYREVIREVNSTMRTETQSEDEYVRRWRPNFGYTMAWSWKLMMIVIGAVVLAGTGVAAFGDQDRARIIYDGLAALIAAVDDMWLYAMAVLGLTSAARSRDKARAAGAPTAFELITDRILKRAPPATGKKS